MGEWKDGLMDGVGYMTYPDSSPYLYKSAVWTRGKCQDVVLYYTENDEIFLVANKDNKAQGPAAKIDEDGNITLREYKDNKIANAEPKEAVMYCRADNHHLLLALIKNEC